MTKLDLRAPEEVLADMPGLQESLKRISGRTPRRWFHAAWFVGGLAAGMVTWSFRVGHFVALEETQRSAVEQAVHDVNDPRSGLVSKQPASDMGRYVTREEFSRSMDDVNKKLDRVLDYMIQRR